MQIFQNSSATKLVVIVVIHSKTTIVINTKKTYASKERKKKWVKKEPTWVKKIFFPAGEDKITNIFFDF